MWQIKIADDEEYIRQALEKLIDWEKLGCKLMSIYIDGQELINSLEYEIPDIVITDIKMPVMDGIEVCKYLNECYPEVQIILLTAHSEFEYAKLAIKYNVCEYVLKISIMEDLPDAILKAINSLEKENKQVEDSHEVGGRTLFLQIEKYIEENYKKKISLSDIANDLHANSAYLSRLYKNKTGINLFDAIMDKKIEAAKEYLKTTNLKTYEIAGKLGIDDAGYFSKIFKKRTGLSPRAYKKENVK